MLDCSSLEEGLRLLQDFNNQDYDIRTQEIIENAKLELVIIQNATLCINCKPNDE